MNFPGILGRRPLLHGWMAGVLLPLSIVAAPWALGRMGYLFTGGGVFTLLPVFAALGLVTATMMWWLYPFYHEKTSALSFAAGCLWGGWVSGAILLWVSSADRPLVNRLGIAVFGAPLMVAFWLWVGALLAYAARQRPKAAASLP